VAWLVFWSLSAVTKTIAVRSMPPPALHHQNKTAPPFLVAFCDLPGEVWVAEKFCTHPLSTEVEMDFQAFVLSFQF